MQIEINTGEGVQHSDALDEHIRNKLQTIERRFGERLTRLQVFLKDVNAGKGGVDKSCTMEARPAGLDPVAVEALHEDVYASATQAVDKLTRAIEHRLGRQER